MAAPDGPTPFIRMFKATGSLRLIYDVRKRHNEQANDPWDPVIPPIFLDAMSVREAVYVDEQGVPLHFEFDLDDMRAIHWVIYASVQKPVAPEITDPSTGEILVPRRSSTKTVPIGTIRLIPFPHQPHPRQGGIYVGDRLVNAGSLATEVDPNRSGFVPEMTDEERKRVREPWCWPPGIERETDLHNGQEPYMKLGRLAVLKEFRGRGIASQLVQTAIKWIQDQPDLFDPLASNVGFARVESTPSGGQLLPRWNGLFMCHAQEAAIPLWEKWGFKVDKSLGRWIEEGIPHVAMFLRVPVVKRG